MGTSQDPAGRRRPSLFSNMPTTAPNGVLVFFAIVIDILCLSGLLFTLYYTVKYRSGLREPDKVHRIWSRADEIRYQPVERPLVFSVAMAFGLQTVLTSLFLGIFSLFGTHMPIFSVVGIIVVYLVMGVSSAVSILIYRTTGGSNWKLALLASAGFNYVMYVVMMFSVSLYTKLKHALHEHTGNEHGTMLFLVLFVAAPAFNFVIQALFSLWAGYRQVPPVARQIYNSNVLPNWVKLDRTILMAAGPLLAVHGFGVFVQLVIGHHGYFARLATTLSQFSLLAVAALVSVISVNRALMANEFQWQWRAFLTPAVPLAVMDFVFLAIMWIAGRINFGLFLYQELHLFLSYGSCGALGAYVYLILAERYARNYVDEDVAAQTDLMGEFADDDDNEELEV